MFGRVVCEDAIDRGEAIASRKGSLGSETGSEENS